MEDSIGEEDFRYKSPPPKKIYTVKVRYVYKGKGQPAPLSKDQLEAILEN